MSVVTEETLNIALISYHRTRPHEGAVVAMRAALAAVAPLIAAQERERVAMLLEAAAERVAPTGKRSNQVDRHVADVLRDKAAAIRALGGDRKGNA